MICQPEFERCLLVSPRLNQDIQHFALAVHRPPQIHPFAVDGDKHLVQMPTPIRARTQSSELAGVGQAKLDRPATDGFVTDIDATLGQQVFDIAKAQRKAEIQPHRMLDDFGWKTMAAI